MRQRWDLVDLLIGEGSLPSHHDQRWSAIDDNLSVHLGKLAAPDGHDGAAQLILTTAEVLRDGLAHAVLVVTLHRVGMLGVLGNTYVEFLPEQRANWSIGLTRDIGFAP